MRNPSVLILDEATSALDNLNERLVKDWIEELGGKITQLIIAHRLTTVQNADIIIVMNKGKIVEQGNHSDLS